MGEKKRRTEARVTISDVAQKAGVSRTAVSFVLNEHGERNRYVSEETRAKVWQAVEELHYQPDLLARTLRTGQSLEIAGIMDTSQTPLGLEITLAFTQRALHYGYMPTAYYCQGLSEEVRQDLYQRIFARRPLALIATPEHFTAADVERARASGIEHILFYGFAPVDIPATHTVVIPTRESGYLAAKHLLERGHRHLALLQPMDPYQAYPFRERLAGMQAAIAEHPDAADIALDVLPMDLAGRDAAALVEKSLLQAERPTGIYAFNDEHALFLLGMLAQHSIRVPQDIALVGTDDLPFCAATWPSLTSIHLDGAGIGQHSADLLHALHQKLPLQEMLTPVPTPRLIQRAST
jgi:LacI family transcriptional regulator